MRVVGIEPTSGERVHIRDLIDRFKPLHAVFTSS